MPALDQTVAIMLLNGLSAQSAFTASTSPLKLRLTLNAPTATVAGTEISGTGYTAGGSTITFGAPTGTATGALMVNTGALTWTNGGVASWQIVGSEVWDSAGTPRRIAYGAWDDQPLTIGPGSPFQVAIGGYAISFP